MSVGPLSGERSCQQNTTLCPPVTPSFGVALRSILTAVITAAIWKYDIGTKIMMLQTIRADYICFTDNQELSNPGKWILDFTPYNQLNFSGVSWLNQATVLSRLLESPDVVLP
jgi:hypothetical protein